MNYSLRILNRFIFKKVIRKRIIRRTVRRIGLKGTRTNYLKHKENARRIVKEKIEHFNKVYNFEYRRVFIKNQKTRWGSCSKNGNLNFNYKISLLPDHLSSYIVVHELCHLGQFNHSKDFWDLVAVTYPDYKKAIKELKSINLQNLV